MRAFLLSPFTADCPGIFYLPGFSPANTPHLTPALELDNAMVDFSKSLAEKHLPTVISSNEDIDMLLGAFREEIKALKFWQYYVLDGAKEKEVIKEALPSAPVWSGPAVVGKTVVELAQIARSAGVIDESKKFHSRFAITSKPEQAAGLVKAAFTELSDDAALAEAWIRIVDVINVPLYQEWEDDTKVAMENIKNRAHYTRVADHGPKLGEITEE